MYAQIGMQKLQERAKIIKDNPKFLENCSKALLEIAEEKELSKKDKNDKTSKDPHNQLYSGGFPENKDQEIMKKFHTIDWSQRFPLLQSLKDERFKYFGERLIYQNQPESLPKKDFDRIHIETMKRLLKLEERKFYYNSYGRTANR